MSGFFLRLVIIAIVTWTKADAFCFRTYGTWISRYHYHTSESQVNQAFQALKNAGITRVYINVWADGYIYAKSSTATANGAVFIRDTLQWAVNAGRLYGLEVFAWFEYGTQAHYGTTPSTRFASSCNAKGWLLKTGNGGYTSHSGGNYVYADATNAAVRQFYTDMSADLVKNYAINGIQYDDHMSLPSGFVHIDALSHSQRFKVMEDFMTQIKNSVKTARKDAIVSYSPSTIDFSQTHHNVNWESYLQHGVVDEIVPQYYRASSNDYKLIINRDIPRLHGHQSSLIGGIRLSGSGAQTPAGEVQKMIELSYANKFKGVSFWFGDDIITGVYKPPKLSKC